MKRKKKTCRAILSGVGSLKSYCNEASAVLMMDKHVALPRSIQSFLASLLGSI